MANFSNQHNYHNYVTISIHYGSINNVFAILDNLDVEHLVHKVSCTTDASKLINEIVQDNNCKLIILGSMSTNLTQYIIGNLIRAKTDKAIISENKFM